MIGFHPIVVRSLLTRCSIYVATEGIIDYNQIKSKQQLGVHKSTAQNRLLKDILWKFIQDTGQELCYRCHRAMSREDFSIEHIVPWLDSSDPKVLFYSLDNISYSHLSCNVGAARRKKK